MTYKPGHNRRGWQWEGGKFWCLKWDWWRFGMAIERHGVTFSLKFGPLWFFELCVPSELLNVGRQALEATVFFLPGGQLDVTARVLGFGARASVHW